MKKKMDSNERLEYLKNEKEYLETKLKKITNPKNKYPDKEQNVWFLKIFNDNLAKVKEELKSLGSK